MKTKRAMSLTEIMVCLFILGLISVPLYFLLSDSNKKANIALARDNIKQESTKAFKLLENDFTQARKGTFEQKSNGAVIKVRKNAKNDMDLKYTFNKPTLRREVDGKSWVVSNQVENISISKALDGNGKVIVDLTMKANHVGLLDEEQPTYEQQKLIVMIEDATEPNDPFWREVGDMSRFFQTQGSLLAGLKEDASQMFQNFADTWSAALADIKNMTVGELKKVASDIKEKLEEAKENLASINKDVLELDNEALYDRHFFGLFGLTSAEKRSARRVKETLAGFSNAKSMSWSEVMQHAQSDMKEDSIRSFFEAKEKIFATGGEMIDQLDKIENQAGCDVGAKSIDRETWGR